MKKVVWFTAIVTIFALLVSCSCSSDDGDSNNGENNGNGGGTTEQWAAYVFDETVSPSSGTSGKIDTFTIEETIVDDDGTRKFKIEGDYLGKSTDIKTTKMNLTTFETSTVTTYVECYKIKHRITVMEAPAGEDYPTWADVTVYVPTGGFETTAIYFWVYPMATYLDSDGNTGEWAYYLTSEMQTEMEQGTVNYIPYVDGDFNEYDDWSLFGLYGWVWTWFSSYATGGDNYLEAGNMSFSGFNYSCAQETKTVSSYTFDVWTVSISGNAGGESFVYEGSFSPGLPLPFYLKVGSNTTGDDASFEYTLTDLVLE